VELEKLKELVLTSLTTQLCRLLISRSTRQVLELDCKIPSKCRVQV
jgi:hypothetical protein